MLPVLLGTAGLTLEYGTAVLRKAETQRIADSAAYAGALAFNNSADQTGGTTAQAEMRSSATAIATLNNVDPSNVAVSLIASPNLGTNQAVSVDISARVPLYFSRMILPKSSLQIRSTAVAELTAVGGTCINALQAVLGPVTAAIGIDGGAVINALLCSVAANAGVTVPCGTGINTLRLSYNSALPPDSPCNGIKAPVGQILSLLKKQAVDPYGADAAINLAKLRTTTDLLLLSPLPPIVLLGLATINFSSNQILTKAGVPLGCTATLAGTVWTLACSGNTLLFNSITVASGYDVKFVTTSTAATTIGFSGSVTNSGKTLSFGSGTFNIAGGIKTAAGSTTTFGASTIRLGSTLLSSCSAADTGTYSLCNLGTFNVTGAVDLTASSGIYNGAAGRLQLGTGTGNAFRIGSSSNGNALHTGAGSTSIFADSGSTAYRFTGDVDMDGGGGSCLAIGAADQHDFNGSIRTADATVFGPGTYTVTGAVLLGINGRVDSMCKGSSVGVYAAGVTFVLGGNFGVPISGPCTATAFCVVPGYGSVVLTAPNLASSPLAGVAIIGPALNTSAVLFADGLNNTSLSGLFYVPLGVVTISGGASVGNGLGQCLELVVAQLLVHGGNIFAAPCKSGGPIIHNVRLIG